MAFPLVAQPKPERGEYRAEKLAKRAQSKSSEKAEKAKARKRDGAACKGYCRWPGCKVRTYLEVSHLKHKSMGGNPANDRSVAERMIQVCQPHHRGGRSIDTGDLEVRPLTLAGTDGPCEFWQAFTLMVDGSLRREMKCIAYETSIGIYHEDTDFRVSASRADALHTDQ